MVIVRIVVQTASFWQIFGAARVGLPLQKCVSKEHSAYCAGRSMKTRYGIDSNVLSLFLSCQFNVKGLRQLIHKGA